MAGGESVAKDVVVKGDTNCYGRTLTFLITGGVVGLL